MNDDNSKNILYSKLSYTFFSILTAVSIFATIYAAHLDQISVFINTTKKIYRITDDFTVINGYTVTIKNTQDKSYTFDIKVEDNENVTVNRFRSIRLDPDRRTKKILVLEANSGLNLSDRKSTPFDVKVTIFAKENPEIKVTREIPFIYPRNDLLK